MTAALAICLSMAACGDTAKDESSEKETTAATTTAAEEETEATEEEPAEAEEGDEDVDIEITLLEGDTVEMTVKAGEIYATDWMTVSSIVIK
jgi:ABC-type glycerol-3-phosphate transport system substrate-binding protein